MKLWKSLCENNSSEMFVSVSDCIKENGYEFEVIKLTFWLISPIVGVTVSHFMYLNFSQHGGMKNQL